MPKGGGGRGVRMKMPNMSNGALQASLARMQADAAKQQDLLVEEKAEHSGVVTNVAPTINSQTGAQQNYPSWFNGDQRHRSMVIYPIYLSAEKSVAQGRRVPKSLAVTRPKSQEILDILTYTGYKCVLLKDKLHPKDNYKSDPCNWGRVHLEFKGEDGKPILPKIATTKAQLLRFIGSKVPLLKSRVVAPAITTKSQPATKTGTKTETKPEPKPAPKPAQRKQRKKRK